MQEQPFIARSLNWFLNVLTCGKANQLSRQTSEHARARDEWICARHLLREAQEVMAPGMVDLGEAKKRAIRCLARAVYILGDSAGAWCETAVPGADVTHAHASFEDTIDDFEASVIAAKGLGAGSAGAAGAWALVSTFGTGPTGIAIGALRGAAATNATLAWLGGGTLAAGAVTLTGIVTAPVGIFTLWHLNRSYRKRLTQVRKEIASMDTSHIRFTMMALEFRKSPVRIVAVTDSIRQCTRHLESEYSRARRWLYPWPVVSRVLRSARRLHSGTMLREGDEVHAATLRASAELLRRAVTQQIFDLHDLVCTAALVYPQESQNTLRPQSPPNSVRAII